MLLDYDGSLAPIVDDPAAAIPDPRAPAVLARLARSVGRVAVVSGRPAAFLLKQLAPAVGDAPVRYAGAYGLERVVDGRVVLDPRAGEWAQTLADVAADAERVFPYLLVERKGVVGVAVHWRTRPDAGEAVAAWVERTASAAGLATVPSRMAVELRAPIPVDKGTTARELVEGARCAAFAGDDTGDVAAFAALRSAVGAGELDLAVAVAVRSVESPAALLDTADVVVDGPGGLLGLLDALADAISARG